MAQHPGLPFRPDVQGLRAVAVTVVVLGHADVPGFAGGFIGVDLFFVLSGFLITGLLVEEHQRTGRLRIGAFLARRLRRLLPALLVMLLGVLLLAHALLSSWEANLQTGSFAFAATWVSNFYFALVELDYFADLQAKDLFLHTWSLGVEEQFYLAWPWLLLLAFAAPRRGGRRHAATRRSVIVVALVAFASLAMSAWWAYQAPLLGFYMMPARGWQFALGALVYLALRQRRHAPPAAPAPAARKVLAGFAGLAAIAASVVLMHDALRYPGVHAVWPSLGAALLLYAGAEGARGPVPRILSMRAAVWLGDRSYSLYLWHWPVLVLGDAYHVTGTTVGKVALIGSSVFLATASHRWVELPPWRGRFAGIPLRLTGLLAVFAMSLCIALAMTLPRHPAVAPAVLSERDAFAARLGGLACDSWHHSDALEPCTAGPVDAAHTVVLIGDSIGTQWAPLLPRLYPAPHWRVIALRKSACTIANLEYFYAPIGTTYDVCTRWRQRALDYIAMLRPDLVLIGSAATADFSADEWIDGTRDVLRRLAPVASRVVLIAGTPALSFDGPSCLREPYRFTGRLRESRGLCAEALVNDVAEHVARYLAHAAGAFDNVHLLNLNDLVCPQARCAARSIDGLAVFRDRQHLTDRFVIAQSEAVAARLGMLGVDAVTLGAGTLPARR